MGDNKNYTSDPKPRDLKRADAEKSTSAPLTGLQTEATGVDLSGFKRTENARKNRKMPIAVDILIAILMLAIVAGVITGAYFLFRYYSDDYEGILVEYTFIEVGETQNLVRYRSMKNQDVYIDGEDNTHYLGEVISAAIVGVDEENGLSMLVLVVRSNAKYRKGEGYTVGDYRIAVGAEYTLRSERLTVDCTIVDMEGYGAVESSDTVATEAPKDENQTVATQEEGGQAS